MKENIEENLYTLEELIDKLEAIRVTNEGQLSLPKALYRLTLEISDLWKAIDRLSDQIHGTDD